MRTVMATRASALLVGAGLLLLAGCASKGLRPDELEQWVGRPSTALEKAWGPATREVPDQGLRLLVYEELEDVRAVNTQGGGTSNRAIGCASFASLQRDLLVLRSDTIRSFPLSSNRSKRISIGGTSASRRNRTFSSMAMI